MAVQYRDMLYYYNSICWDHLIINSTHCISANIYLEIIMPTIVKIENFKNILAGNQLDYDTKQSDDSPFGDQLDEHISIVGSSETIRINSYEDNEDQFGYWLAGLIDGDGSLLVSKKGYTSCEIILHTTEVQALYKIKSKLGGIVTPRIKTNAFRWRLHNKLGMIKLIDIINGKLQHPIKHEQLIKICNILNILPITKNILSNDNAWFTGFFDAEGSLNCNAANNQLSLSIGQKDKFLLKNILKAFGVGSVYSDNTWKGFKLYFSAKADLEVFINYFTQFPLITRPKSSDLITFKRLMIFKEKGYHLLPLDHKWRIRFENLGSKLRNRKK